MSASTRLWIGSLALGLTGLLATGCAGATAVPATNTPPPDYRFDFTLPQGSPPTIDGTLSPGEWYAARVETFSDGSELFLMAGDGYLYLGIRSSTPEIIGANVFIDHCGEDVGGLKLVDNWSNLEDVIE